MPDNRWTVIRGGLVLTPSFTPAEADIICRGDEIHEIVPRGGPAPADAIVIDAADRAIMPGLVNAHVHGHGTLAKGRVEDRWPLELFLNALPGLGANRTVEHKYLNGLVGAVEMIRKGSTTCYDLFFEFPMPSRDGVFALGQAYMDAGVRAVIAPMVADRTFYQAYPELLDTLPEPLRSEALSLRMAPFQASADAAAEIFRAWPFDRDRVRPGIAPTIPLHCSDELLIRCGDLVREFGIVLQTHLAESKPQAVIGLKRYGKTLTAHLADLGLLGPHLSAAHGIWIDDDDMRLLAGSGASVVHAPASNMRFGSGLAQIRKLLDHGVNVGLASDGANSSDSLNMFEMMRVGTYISRIVTPEFDHWLDTAETLFMATEGSARAMGFGSKIGRIEAGYQADLVLLDLAHINYVPLGDLARQILFTENGAAVDSVMIAGRLVLDRGRITTLDEAKLRRDAQSAADWLFAQNASIREASRRLAPLVGAFCKGLACEHYHVHRLASAPGIGDLPSIAAGALPGHAS
jgi:5-methylthioadenosine/S-adenosylhomocysteine deaminase